MRPPDDQRHMVPHLKDHSTKSICLQICRVVSSIFPDSEIAKDFRWMEQYQRTFEDLKNYVSSPLLLGKPELVKNYSYIW